eukprot:5642604-Prymnesium_polylepis.1
MLSCGVGHRHRRCVADGGESGHEGRGPGRPERHATVAPAEDGAPHCPLTSPRRCRAVTHIA